MNLIETPRTRLTQPPPDAAAEVLDYFERNRAHLAPWSPVPPPRFYTLEFWLDRLLRNREEAAEGESLRLFVQPRRGREIIGSVNFSEIVRGVFQACYLGYSIDQAEEGKGLMHEAVEAGVRYVFDELRLHRIMANYVPTNERSGALLRRLGFSVEGYARDYLFINGAWRDHIMTALTNPQAPEPKPR